MSERPTSERSGLNRRALLRRGAVIGGNLVWTVPTVQSLARPAFAQNSTGGTTMHVQSLTPGAQDQGPNWRARVTVLVHDDLESPVQGAAVTGSFAPVGGVKSGTTGAGGAVQLQSDAIDDAVGSVIFTLSAITHATSLYNAADNGEAVVTINQPTAASTDALESSQDSEQQGEPSSTAVDPPAADPVKGD